MVRSVWFGAVVAAFAGCAAQGNDDDGGRLAGALTVSQKLYDDPIATPSYVPSTSSAASGKKGVDNLGGGGVNFSWDAKLVFNAIEADCLDAQGKTAKCAYLAASGMHPEAVPAPDYTKLNALPISNLGSSSLTQLPVVQGAFVHDNDDGSCPDGDGEYIVGPGDRYGTFTVVPASPSDVLPRKAPGYRGKGTCSATSDALVRYNFTVYADQNFAAYDPVHPDAHRCATNGKDGNYRQQGFVIVDNSNTGHGDPCYTELSPPALDKQTYGGSDFVSIESSVSADGRLMVMNSGGILDYSFNPTPNNSRAWSPPASLSHLYHQLIGQTVVINGVSRPATDVVPLALAPLKKADGSEFADGEVFAGAYPWVSSDATEVFYQAVRITQNGAHRGVTRAGTSVIGRLTGNIERHIDDWANRDRGNLNDEHFGTQRTNPRSVGLVPGLWNNWRDPSLPLPLEREAPVYPLFVQGETHTYSEVRFDSFADGSDVLYLEMNELVVPVDGKKEFDASRTADISGHVHNGKLNAGALIPEYITYASRTDSVDFAGAPFFVSAKAASFTPSGALTVQSTPVLRDFGQGLSLGFFIRQDSGAAALAGQDVSVVSLPSAVSAKLNGNTMTLTLECAGKSLPISFDVFGSPKDDDWKHVALTYKPLTNLVTAYLDAKPVGTGHCNNLAKAAFTATDPLVAGPNVAANNGSKVVYWLDQLRLSRVERSVVQIAADARVHLTITAPDGAIPIGLAASDLKLAPGQTYDPDKAQLGSDIFNDTSFSANDSKVACATCHDASSAFADPRGVSRDLSGNPLPRNAPSLFNRAFGGPEMWDGAHSSLESQATAPFLNAKEMGLTVTQLTDIAQKRYGARFQRLYGVQPTQLTIADAVGRFTRTLVSGGAPFDVGTMTDAQKAGFDLFRGKARCIGCHNGPTFSDEQFHREGFSVLTSKDDAGRSTFACGANDSACQSRLKGWFKTPSLRNVGVTGPYFHNGKVGTLADVVTLYNAGPDDMAVPSNYDSIMRPLGLTSDEQAQLVDFLTNALASPTGQQR